MKLPTRNIPGHETFYVECQCVKDERETLFKELRKSASDAIKVQLHNDQQGIILYESIIIIMQLVTLYKTIVMIPLMAGGRCYSSVIYNMNYMSFEPYSYLSGPVPIIQSLTKFIGFQL